MKLRSITFALSAIVAIVQAAPLLPVVDELTGIVGGLTQAAPGGLPIPPVNDVPLSKRVLDEFVPDLGILPKPQVPGLSAVPQVPRVPQVPALDDIPLLRKRDCELPPGEDCICYGDATLCAGVPRRKRGIFDQLVPDLGLLPQAPGLPALPQTPATPNAAPYHTWDNVPQLGKRAIDDFKNIVDPTAPVQDPTIVMNPTVPLPPSPFDNSVFNTIPVPLPGGPFDAPLPDLNTEGTQMDHTVERDDLASAAGVPRVMGDHTRVLREKPQGRRVADDLASAAGVPRVMGDHHRVLREKPQGRRVAKRDDLTASAVAGVPHVMGDPNRVLREKPQGRRVAKRDDLASAVAGVPHVMGDSKLVRKIHQVTKHDLATAGVENVIEDRHRLFRKKPQHNHHRVAQA